MKDAAKTAQSARWQALQVASTKLKEFMRKVLLAWRRAGGTRGARMLLHGLREQELQDTTLVIWHVWRQSVNSARVAARKLRHFARRLTMLVCCMLLAQSPASVFCNFKSLDSTDDETHTHVRSKHTFTLLTGCEPGCSTGLDVPYVSGTRRFEISFTDS